MTLATEHPDTYVGPRAFKPGEQLHGRDRETTELLDVLLSERIVLLHSPSGAGKSSLLQARLIPRLEQQGFAVHPVLRVGTSATTEAPDIWNRYTYSSFCSVHPKRVAERVMSLDDLLSDGRGPATSPELLIIDQFEEILTHDPSDLAGRRDFFVQLGDVLRNRSRWAVIAMREEFIGALDPYLALLPTRLGTRYRLDLLDAASARAAIRNPADEAGVPFEDEAASMLLGNLQRVRLPGADAVQHGAGFIEPLHLQVVCTRMWKNRSNLQKISVPHVRAFGDVDKALALYYRDAVVQASAHSDEGSIRDWIEEKLIVNRMRSQALRGSETAHGVSDEAVRKLVDAWIIRVEERRQRLWYELAHDRLVYSVIDDNAAFRESALTQLEKQANSWHEQSRAEGLLINYLDVASIRAGLRVRRQARKGYLHGRQLVLDYVNASLIGIVMQFGKFAVAAIVILVLFSPSFKTRSSLDVETNLAALGDSLARTRAALAEDGWGVTGAARYARSREADLSLQQVLLDAHRDSGLTIVMPQLRLESQTLRISAVLSDLGYEVREAAPLATPDSSILAVGSGIDSDDMRIIALSLARSGLSIYSVCKSDEPAFTRAVQVLSSRNVTAGPGPLPTEELRELDPGMVRPCRELARARH